MANIDIKLVKQRYGIIGNSDGLNHALNVATKVASTDLNVLILGESGSGKEIIPKIIHDCSSRKHEKYFAINCGSIPEGTIDSELFGHEKGAFTGAIGEREGFFGAANKGTLFLDEVGELPLSTQARLLRVLETGEYIRVGSSQVRKTDVRIVAATNVNLQKAITEGRFREDLYYRLATIPITIPSLRERGKDIELLFRKFARDTAERYRLEPIVLSEDGIERLGRYKWPGNIREMKNIVERICLLSHDRVITANILQEFDITDDSTAGGGIVIANPSQSSGQFDYASERTVLFHMIQKLTQEVNELKNAVQNCVTPTQVAPTIQVQNPQFSIESGISMQSDGSSEADKYEDAIEVTTISPIEESAKPRTMAEMEKESIVEALKRNNGNKKKTAKELKISERTLYRKVKQYEIEK